MNHTPVKTVNLTAGSAATTISDKHRAIIISNTGVSTSTVTLTFTTTQGVVTGNFDIRVAANSGPFYIPCKIASAAATSSNVSILLLA